MNKHFWDYPLRKHHRLSAQIRPFVSPLVETFALSQFCYFFVTQEGHAACLSSHPEWTEFYHYNGLFLHNPFLRKQEFLPEGVFFSESIQDPGFLESKNQARHFGIGDSLLITSRERSKWEGFSFNLKASQNDKSFLINELPLLKRFCQEFKKHARKTLLELSAEPIDLLPLIGEIYYQPSIKSPYLNQKKRTQLLSQLQMPLPHLSRREKECLLLYLQGETARSMAAFLGLSQRTIEDYLENIKNKLSCFDKPQLLKKAKVLQDLGLLSPYFLRLDKHPQL